MKKRGYLMVLLSVLLLTGCAAEPAAAPIPETVEFSLPAEPAQEPAAETPSAPEPVREIRTESALTLRTGDTHTLTYTLLPEDAVNPTVTFSVQGDSVTVDEQGRVQAVRPGDSQVILSTDSCFTVVNVTVEPVPWESVSLEEEWIMGVGDPFNALRIAPANADILSVAVESSDAGVFTADEQGLPAAVGKGTARVRLTVTGAKETFTGECEVTVTRGSEPDRETLTAPRYESAGEQVITNNQQGDTATLFCLGDLMCIGAQQRAAAAAGGWNFTGSFACVKDLLSRADLVIGNLETVVSHSNDYTSEHHVEEGAMPFCNAPSSYVEALRWAGLDAVVTSNNHCADCGLLGMRQTLEQLSRYDLFHTGMSISDQVPPYLITQVNGIRVGFVSYSTAFNGKHRAFSEEDQTALLHKFSKEAVRDGIRQAKAAGAEYVIVYIHWGTENQQAPDEQELSYGQIIADAGADLIVGSHPHVLQKAAYLTAADGRQVPIVYSMGNFVSSMGSTENNDAIVLSLTLTRQNGAVSLSDWCYYPCRVMNEYNGVKRVVVPCDYEADNKTLQNAAKRIAAVMGDAISPAN